MAQADITVKKDQKLYIQVGQGGPRTDIRGGDTGNGKGSDGTFYSCEWRQLDVSAIGH